MNDNTNILLGGGELLLYRGRSAIPDHAGRTCSSWRSSAQEGWQARAEGARRRARYGQGGAVAAHKLYCETDAEPAKEVKEYAASSLQKYTNLVSKALPRREPDEVNGAEEVLIVDVDRPDGAGSSASRACRHVDNARADQLRKLNVEVAALGAATSRRASPRCARTRTCSSTVAEGIRDGARPGLSETEIRALAAAGVAEARNSFEGAVAPFPVSLRYRHLRALPVRCR